MLQLLAKYFHLVLDACLSCTNTHHHRMRPALKGLFGEKKKIERRLRTTEVQDGAQLRTAEVEGGVRLQMAEVEGGAWL